MKTTNHILHLLLSVLTGGVWIIVWIIVAHYNSNHNDALKREEQGLKPSMPLLHSISLVLIAFFIMFYFAGGI